MFNLAKKFFVSDANISRDDPVLLHLLYIQCRDDIASGKLVATYLSFVSPSSQSSFT